MTCPNTHKQHELVLREGDTITIGRLPINDIVFLARQVSREHAKIICKDGQIFVTDLRSTRGTFIVTKGKYFLVLPFFVV